MSSVRKACDVVVMFKTMILERLYKLGDAAVDFREKDRSAFMRFMHLNLAGCSGATLLRIDPPRFIHREKKTPPEYRKRQYGVAAGMAERTAAMK